MGAGYVLYAIVDAEGKPRRKRTTKGQASGALMIYTLLADAKRLCRVADAVVELTLDLGREPLFIKARKGATEETDGDA